MAEFRPTLAPSPTPKPSARRPATFAALGLIAVLSVAVLWPADGPAPTGTTQAAPATTWDSAIAAISGADIGPSPIAASDEMPGRAPLETLALEPHRVGGEVAGYEIQPGDLPAPIRDAGLQAGDVLTTIDGLPIDAARAKRLAEEFGGLDDVEVGYQRGGELRDTMIVFVER